eukprot:TRINITY_DN7771_c0_g1_i2.p1 TRINITY_DN7771_c0_g1~~TRINITY_DN7771_c0_g1_i2.p1  ORF type:complete len:244 (-),score=40.34 TRINITY_DN7771_c0_g1_i2:179-910(-)
MERVAAVQKALSGAPTPDSKKRRRGSTASSEQPPKECAGVPVWHKKAGEDSARWVKAGAVNREREAYIQEQRAKWLRTRKTQAFTLEDVVQTQTAHGEVEQPCPGRIHTVESTLFDPDKLGREMLDLTNAFRALHNRSRLEWHGGMVRAGVEHSKAMGDGKVPFSHQGFHQRVGQFPFQHSGAGENVAMSQGHPEVAKTAVDGWIKSPGHRENLLGEWTLCAIGVYRNQKGAWYSTQLFAKTS